MLPGSLDDLIAQRIEHYREMLEQGQNPVTTEKFHIAIHALANTPRQIGKLQNALLNKKMEHANTTIAMGTGMVPPSWAHSLLIEIEEYEWLLAQLHRKL